MRGTDYRTPFSASRGRIVRAPRAHEPSPTSRVALELFSRGESSVGQVTRLLAFSRRHFIEVLAAKVGMRPKLFLRIQRFQRAFAQIGRMGQAQRAARRS